KCYYWLRSHRQTGSWPLEAQSTCFGQRGVNRNRQNSGYLNPVFRSIDPQHPFTARTVKKTPLSIARGQFRHDNVPIMDLEKIAKGAGILSGVVALGALAVNISQIESDISKERIKEWQSVAVYSILADGPLAGLMPAEIQAKY